MKTEEYIMIDSRDINLEEIEINVWKFSLDGIVHFIRYDDMYDGMYYVSREHNCSSHPSDEGEFYDSVFVAQFDNPFKAINFVLNEIF
jgi:hypothetical protein